MKTRFAITMALLLSLLILCACASPEKRLENIIEQQTGQNVDIKDGGNSITIEGDGGESVTVTTGDDQEWPAGKLGDLPELKGKITGIYEANGAYVLSIEGVGEKDAKAYLQKLKDLGYANGMEMTQDSLEVFSGSTDKAEVMFQYSIGSDNRSCTVSLTYSPKPQ